MKKGILTVTLNPAVDKTVTVDKFSVGKEFFARSVVNTAGGKGLNVSRTLSHLGVENKATGLVGGASGQIIKQSLAAEKIPYSFIEITGATRTNETIIDNTSGAITRIFDQSPIATRKNEHAFVRLYSSLIKKASAVALSGRNIGGFSKEIYAHLINIAHRAKVFSILDTHSVPLLEGLNAKPDMIKPNLAEAEFILKKRLRSSHSLKKAVRYFLELGIGTVCISLENKGAVASNGDEIWFAQAPKVAVVNTVGCGDAFIGGFLGARKQRCDFKQSVKYAVATGTTNSLSVKPGGICPATVKRISRQVKITKM